MWWIVGFIIYTAIVLLLENKGAPVQKTRKQWYREEYLHSKHWRKTRNRALARSNFMCSNCRATHGLQVHHLTYTHLGHELDSDLKVLCSKCHKQVHKK